MPSRTSRSSARRRGRRGARAVGLAAAAGLLAGCALNAGSAASDAFVAHMEGADGVTATAGFLSNDLPFRGSGPVQVWFSPTASDVAVREAVEQALGFDPAVGTELTGLILSTGRGDPTDTEVAGEPGDATDTGGAVGDGDAEGDAESEGAAGDEPVSVSFEVEWDTAATTAADRFLALRATPGVLVVVEDPPGQVRLTVRADADACEVADQVEQALDEPAGSVERIAVDGGPGVERWTCAG